MEHSTGQGTALYARANVFAGPVTVLLEGKRYRKFEFFTRNGSINRKTPVFYHLAPTIERFDQQVFNNTDTSGARVKVDYGIRSTKTRLHFNTMMNVYAPSFGEDPWDPNSRYALHVYGGVNQKFGGEISASFSGGWREERERGKDEKLYRKLWHVEGELGMPLAGSQGLSFKQDFRNEVKNVAFVRSLSTLTYSVQPAFSVSALIGYSTERVEVEPVHHAAGQVDVGLGTGALFACLVGVCPEELCVQGGRVYMCLLQ